MPPPRPWNIDVPWLLGGFLAGQSARGYPSHMTAPFKLEQALPITRDLSGRFREFDRALPANPNAQSEGGQQPERWAPGVGKGTAPMSAQQNPYPPVTPRGPGPMKLGG